MKLDSVDLKIIRLLQKDARISIAGIARNLKISSNAAHQRYKKIQKLGIIKQTFIPTFLPKYSTGKATTYKMQMIVRSTNREAKEIEKNIKGFKVENSQIECWETVGHYNFLVWIISENPINLHLLKDNIQNQTGVIEVKAVIVSEMIDYTSNIELHHLEEGRNG